MRRWFRRLPLPREWLFDPVALPDSGDKLRDAALNGEHAKRLLEDELLRWALGQIRERIRTEMETCPIRDGDGLLTLRLWAEVAKAFEANLQSLVNDGRMAEAALAKLERDAELEKRYGRIAV